jgi:hypothetical protein
MKVGYDLKLSVYTKFTKNQNILKNSYLFKNDEKKHISCTWTTISIYYNKLPKQLFQNEKKKLGKRTYNPFLK